MNNSHTPPPWTEWSLRTMLRRHEVPEHTWHTKAPTKAVSDLLNEVATGKSFISTESGRLIRTVHVLALTVLHRDKSGALLRLMRHKRVTPKGTRMPYFDSSLGEKMLPGERILTTTIRALRSELNIALDPDQCDALEFTHIETITQETFSRSYPGLNTRYHLHRMHVTLPAEFVMIGDNAKITSAAGAVTHFEWVAAA